MLWTVSMPLPLKKVVIDFEIIRQVKASFAPIEVNEETLNLEEIKEIGHDGSFVTSDYTLENYRDLYSPPASESAMPRTRITLRRALTKRLPDC